MSDSEEETYSTIFASLKHPIRRRILRVLSTTPESFSDLQKGLRIESPHLTYHLEGLGNLLFKAEDGRYALSSLGQAAVSTMNQVEETPRTPSQLSVPSRRWKISAVALLVVSILLFSLFFFQYQALSQLSIQYSNLKEEHELFQEALREVLDLGNATLAHKYTINETLATGLFIPDNRTFTEDNMSWVSVGEFRWPWGFSMVDHLIHVLTDNCTLEMRVSLPRYDPSWTNLRILVGKEERIPNGSAIVATIYENGTTTYGYSDAVSYGILFDWKVTNSSTYNGGTYSVVLPSRGKYMIFIELPFVQDEAEHYIMHYTMTLQIKGQRDHIPFFIPTEWD